MEAPSLILERMGKMAGVIANLTCLTVNWCGQSIQSQTSYETIIDYYSKLREYNEGVAPPYKLTEPGQTIRQYLADGLVNRYTGLVLLVLGAVERYYESYRFYGGKLDSSAFILFACDGNLHVELRTDKPGGHYSCSSNENSILHKALKEVTLELEKEVIYYFLNRTSFTNEELIWWSKYHNDYYKAYLIINGDPNLWPGSDLTMLCS